MPLEDQIALALATLPISRRLALLTIAIIEDEDVIGSAMELTARLYVVASKLPIGERCAVANVAERMMEHLRASAVVLH
jgi:hypothetical protein